jgi:manganese/zinc/iron transport system substrate-binding protein
MGRTFENRVKKTLQGLGMVLLFLWPACQTSPESDGVFRIVCTTGIIADVVSEIAGDQAQVEALMQPGVDPHLYKATLRDLGRLRTADVIFYNGLHLEGKMAEVLHKLARKKPVFALSDGIDTHLLITVNGKEQYDPHIWFDTQLWGQSVQYIASVLMAQDPAHKAVYQERASQFLLRLGQIEKQIRHMIQEIPESQRILVTSHDAFLYFGRAFGLQVKGLQGISTMSEFGLKDVSDLVNFIIARDIRAVFVESAISSKPMEAVVLGCQERGHTIRLAAGALYADALGQPGTQAGSYTGMLLHNAETIRQALQ